MELNGVCALHQSAERVLVTGVSGFVGSAVARALHFSGCRLRGMVRVASARTNLNDFPGELIEGDMRDQPAVERALAGCDALIHVAADYRLWARDPHEIVRNNEAGTRATMQAARAASIAKIVYTSSVATLAPMSGRPSDETHPLTPATAIGAYKRSKVVAERLVEAMIGEGLPAVIVHPSTPIGPRDARPTPTGRIVVEAALGRMPAYVETGLNLVHVDDCARGHVLALQRGEVGRHYILGGADVPLSAFLAEIAARVGRRPPRLALPIAPLVPLAHAAETWARLSGREPFLTLDALKMARHHMYFTSARAQAELRYTSRDWREGVADALGWFRAAGMVG